MEWRAEGVLLAVRRHGESAAIIEVFTEAKGRAAGIVRGGSSRRWAPILQPGAQLDVTWRARLEEHLGAFTVEPVAARAEILGDRMALAGLGAVTGLVSFALPERHAYPLLYRETVSLLDQMAAGEIWQAHYVAWELELLKTLGFGLDLAQCAVTGAREDLVYVSPKSGRAVSRAAGAEWAEKLLPLPHFLRADDGGGAPIRADDLRAGLKLTGYFLSAWACPALGRAELPPGRDRLLRAFGRL